MHLQSIVQIITGLQLMFFWVGEPIIEAGNLEIQLSYQLVFIFPGKSKQANKDH